MKKAVLILCLGAMSLFSISSCAKKFQLGIVDECNYDEKNHIYHIKLICPKNHKDYGIHSRTFRHKGDSIYFKKPKSH